MSTCATWVCVRVRPAFLDAAVEVAVVDDATGDVVVGSAVVVVDLVVAAVVVVALGLAVVAIALAASGRHHHPLQAFPLKRATSATGIIRVLPSRY